MMMTTPTKFKPVILKNVWTSKTYLDMFMHMLPKSDTWIQTKKNIMLITKKLIYKN